MKVKVNLESIIIDNEDATMQEGDIKIEGTKIIIRFSYFKTLEEVFKKVRKGFEDFDRDFEFRM